MMLQIPDLENTVKYNPKSRIRFLDLIIRHILASMFN